MNKTKDKNSYLMIEICMGSSCFARGNKDLVDTVKEYIKENDLQQKIYLKGNLCMEACENGPNMKINDEVYNEVNKIKAIDLINSHIDGE